MFRLHANKAVLLSILGMFIPCIAQAGEKYALLIGVRQYTNKLRSLHYAEADLVGLAAAFEDAGYRPENVILMTETLGAEDKRYLPLHANIRRELRLLLRNRNPADTVLVAFAGHGIQFLGTKEPYFCPRDADLHDKTTLIGLNEVYQELQECRAGVRLLMVDACRDDPRGDQSRALPDLDPIREIGPQDNPSPRERGTLFRCAAIQSDQPRGIPKVDLESTTRPQDRLPPRGVVALFSCSAGQRAYESDQLKHSVFYNFVIKGLRGEADLFGDNDVTLEELVAYTAKRVKKFVRNEYHEDQVPCLIGETPAAVVLLTLTGKKLVSLGISNRNVTPRLANRLGLPRSRGVEIQGVLPGLAAAKVGLRRGDVLLKVNNTAIADSDGLESALAKGKPGDSITVEVLRSGERLQVKVVLEARLSRPELAQRFLEQAKRGEAWAQYELSQKYAFGDGVTLDTSAAASWCRQAAENGMATAQNSLGWIYRYGDWGMKQNDKEAAKWYLRAAEQGESNAQMNLGDMYRQGQGIRQNDAEATKWYRRAAEDELPLAQNHLGVMYHFGRGVERDETEAVKWYRKAAEQGLPDAQKNLGFMYRIGLGVERDDTEAAKWYRKAAEQGNLYAEDNLGNLYRNGWGVEKDYVKAVKCYRQAAEKGLPGAQNNLGFMYLRGWGVTKDYEEAVKWFRQAADNQLPLAQRNLALMYQHGLGVEKDVDEAVKWYRRAAQKGDVEAKKKLKQLIPE